MHKFSRFAFILLFICTTLVIFALLLFPDFPADDGIRSFASRKKNERYTPRRSNNATMMSFDKYLAERGFTDEQMGNMSLLGKWLLAPEETPPPRSDIIDRNNLILIWKHGSFLERRHIRRFTQNKFSPWNRCSAKNCALSYDEKDLHRADAVVFHLHFTKSPSELPVRNRTDQRWIFLTDESPYHTFLYDGRQKLSDYDGLFNWSMSYRMDSDVPVPYGRTIRISDNISNNNEAGRREAVATRIVNKTKLVAVMGSNCNSRNERWSYVKALKSLLGDDLDILGRCLDGNRTVCPGHFDRDCVALSAYKFYLSFENSNCREYLTEKVFWNAYGKLAVPIIMGASRYDCRRLLPPRSFLHVDDFAGADALADYLRYLDRDDKRYNRYHEWRNRYRVINEHGYFGSESRHYCRVCEALRYNSVAPKVYARLEDFWSKKDCVSAST